MKFAFSMLLDFVQTSRTPEDVGDLLTMTGFELEEILEVEGEPVLDVNIMANRGDAASVFGMARELIAKDDASKPTDLYRRVADGYVRGDESSSDIQDKVRVSIESEDCHRFGCRVFEGVQNGDSPEWMQKRLRQAGMRPISLLVDVANYVMLELGQPLHTFDLDKVTGQQVVLRSAREGETLQTLDEVERPLEPGQLMVCDAEQPMAAAGIMGGLETESTSETVRCLLESAHFYHQSIRRTRKQLGLQTEASYRFERYVDPEGVIRATNRFADLLETSGGPKPVPGVIDHYSQRREQSIVDVDVIRAGKLLGFEVTNADAVRVFKRLGFEITKVEGLTFTVIPPTWRNDIVRQEDLIEELGRVLGYERIPEAPVFGSTLGGGLKGAERMVNRARRAMLEAGFTEVVSHSMLAPHPLDAPGALAIPVRNPASPEHSHLRTSLLPGLALAAQRNGDVLAVTFESGRVFSGPAEKNKESRRIAGWMSDGRRAAHWQAEAAVPVDFYSLKGALKFLGERTRRLLHVEPIEEDDPRFHPTRCGKVVADATGQLLGVIGQLHPLICEELGIATATYAFELDVEALYAAQNDDPVIGDIRRGPAIRRDIAVVIAKDVAFVDVKHAVIQAAGEALERHWLFDIYEGPGVPEGSHSLAIALQLRKTHGTFTDEEANQVRDSVVAALAELGAELR